MNELHPDVLEVLELLERTTETVVEGTLGRLNDAATVAIAQGWVTRQEFWRAVPITNRPDGYNLLLNRRGRVRLADYRLANRIPIPKPIDAELADLIRALSPSNVKRLLEHAANGSTYDDLVNDVFSHAKTRTDKTKLYDQVKRNANKQLAKIGRELKKENGIVLIVRIKKLSTNRKKPES